jgi:hypothetical protein
MLSSEEQMQILKEALLQGHQGPIFELIDEANVEAYQKQAQAAQQQSQETPSVGTPALGGEFEAKAPQSSTERNIIQPGQYKRGGIKLNTKMDHGGPHDKDSYNHIPQDSLINRQQFNESRFKSDAVSEDGATSIAQIMPNTFADGLAKGYVPKGTKYEDLAADDALAEKFQVAYMKDLLGRDWNKGSAKVKRAKSLAAYNMGPTGLVNHLNAEKRRGVDIYDSLDWVDGLGKEAREYVFNIMLGGDKEYEDEYNREHAKKFKEGGVKKEIDPTVEYSTQERPRYSPTDNKILLNIQDSLPVWSNPNYKSADTDFAHEVFHDFQKKNNRLTTNYEGPLKNYNTLDSPISDSFRETFFDRRKSDLKAGIKEIKEDLSKNGMKESNFVPDDFFSSWADSNMYSMPGTAEGEAREAEGLNNPEIANWSKDYLTSKGYDIDEYKKLLLKMRNKYPKYLSSPIGPKKEDGDFKSGGIKKYTDGGVKLSMGAEANHECGPGVQNCGDRESPFTLQRYTGFNYNTGNKNVGMDLDLGTQFSFGKDDTRSGAPVLQTGLSGNASMNIESFKNSNIDAAFDSGLDAYAKVGYKRKSLSSNAKRTNSPGFEAGVYGNYDLLNKNINDVGVYGKYGAFTGNVGYNPQTKGGMLGIGLKFKEGGVRRYNHGGPDSEHTADSDPNAVKYGTPEYETAYYSGDGKGGNLLYPSGDSDIAGLKILPEVQITGEKVSDWDKFEKSKFGKFIDARGAKKMYDDIVPGRIMPHFGYEKDQTKDFALDAAAVFNPIPDFIHAGTKLDEGKYGDAAMYAGFGVLPFAAGPLVSGAKAGYNSLKSTLGNIYKSTKTVLNESPTMAKHLLKGNKTGPYTTTMNISPQAGTQTALARNENILRQNYKNPETAHLTGKWVTDLDFTVDPAATGAFYAKKYGKFNPEGLKNMTQSYGDDVSLTLSKTDGNPMQNLYKDRYASSMSGGPTDVVYPGEGLLLNSDKITDQVKYNISGQGTPGSNLFQNSEEFGNRLYGNMSDILQGPAMTSRWNPTLNPNLFKEATIGVGTAVGVGAGGYYLGKNSKEQKKGGVRKYHIKKCKYGGCL